MPTIDQLAPATAASDSDELLVSQAGITRKVTRAQVLAGVQTQLALPSGSLLGRNSSGSGLPETIAIGPNLALSSGTLSATADSYVVAGLPGGVVPTGGDLVPLSQAGSNVAVSYTQFVSGLAGVSNIDGSQLLLTPSGSKTSVKLADYAASVLPLDGGTMAGPLVLAGDPAGPMQATTKSYVDGQFSNVLMKSGGTLSGALVLAGGPTAPLQAASKDYVDGQYGNALLKSGGTLTGGLTLAGDPNIPLQAATKSYVDAQVGTALPKAGGALSGTLTLPGDPTLLQQAATKNYVDVQVATALPRSGGSLSGALTLAADPSAALQAATKQYVDTRVFRAGDTLTGPLVLPADPVAPLQAASKQYVDNQVASALPKSGGTVTGALSVSADPVSALQVASKHYVDAQMGTALSLNGGTLTGSLILAADPSSTRQAATKQYVDAQFKNALSTTGGCLTGPLTLAGDPAAALQAATKQYVDASPGASGTINVKLPPYNARLDGNTDDTAAFQAAYQAAPAGSVIYVPNGIAKLQNPNNWGIALTKWVKWIVDGTTLSDGTPLATAIPSGAPASFVLPGVVVGNSGMSTEVSQGASQPTDFAILHTSYIVNHSGGASRYVSTGSRNDTIIYNSPNNYVWGGLDRLIWSGTQTPSASAPAQHVGRYVQTIRAAATTDTNGNALPQPQLWTACLEYRDTTGKPSSSTNASITIEMDWYGNGPDDGANRQLQSLVVGQNSLTGAPVEVSSVIGVYLAGGHSGRAYKVINVGIPFSTAVLDTTSATQLAGAAAIRLAAGHAIAFDPSNANKLSYDSASGTLRWSQGVQTYVIGKGITVGFQSVCGSNTTLSTATAGNVVFLIGAGNYTITLPAATAVAAGAGFTFSAIGGGVVTIAPAGGDSIDNGPVTLRQNDRYHIVSDGSGSWREIFRTNAIAPRFVAPPILPSYTVAGLPASGSAGAKAFVSNGRKPNEVAGAGSGVEVFYDGAHWISVCSGTQVVA